MRRLFILIGTLLLGRFSSGQTLSDSQVLAAISHAFSGKHEIGLTLNDLQTNFLSGLTCSTCKTSGYTIFVYTPESWIELQAVQAKREMLPFGLQDVTPEMRLPYIHVLASPSRPEYLSGSGMGMASSVHRVVLSSTDRSDVIQPLSESHAEVESNSALRSFTQASAGAVFSIADVERLRSEDPKREFFVVVVGDNKNKYFKVKDRFFKQLFGQPPPDVAYADVKHDIRLNKPINKRVTGDEDKIPTESHTSSQPGPKEIEPASGGTNARQRGRSEGLPSSQAQPLGTSVRVTPAVSGALTKPYREAGSTALDPQPVESEPTVPATTSAGPSGTDVGKAAARSYDAYKHDNDLIASWWNLREPGLSNSSIAASSKSEINPAFTAGSLRMSEAGSIGAWSDEKPTVRHDGVTVDRIAPDGPADQAGLQAGDDILALGGVYVFTVQELTERIHGYKPDATVSIRYRRRSTIYDSFVVMRTERTSGNGSIKAAK